MILRERGLLFCGNDSVYYVEAILCAFKRIVISALSEFNVKHTGAAYLNGNVDKFIPIDVIASDIREIAFRGRIALDVEIGRAVRVLHNKLDRVCSARRGVTRVKKHYEIIVKIIEHVLKEGLALYYVLVIAFVIVMGGLTGGRRKFLPLVSKDIAQATVEYRLLGKGAKTGVDCIEDAAAAVAWTMKNISRYGGNVKRVYVSGMYIAKPASFLSETRE